MISLEFDVSEGLNPAIIRSIIQTVTNEHGAEKVNSMIWQAHPQEVERWIDCGVAARCEPIIPVKTMAELVEGFLRPLKLNLTMGGLRVIETESRPAGKLLIREIA